MSIEKLSQNGTLKAGDKVRLTGLAWGGDAPAQGSEHVVVSVHRGIPHVGYIQDERGKLWQVRLSGLSWLVEIVEPKRGSLDCLSPELAAYAEVLMDAGFTVYAPTGAKPRRLDFMHYSKVVDGRECFGTASIGYFGEFEHTMPIKPSRQHGSSIIIDEPYDPRSIRAAILHARPTNRGLWIGGVVKENAVPWGIGDRYLPVSQVGTGKEWS